MIIAGAFWSSARTMRAARGREEFSWAGNLAQMIQMSLIAFCVGGAALSMAYYDLFVLCAALLVPLRELVAQQQNALVTDKWRRELVLQPH